MSKSRKLHQLIGTIDYVILGYSKSKPWKNYPFYLLIIDSQSLFTETQKINLYVFANLVSPTLWATLQAENYAEKKYSFWCEKRTRGWRLRNWEELPND